GYAGWPLSPVSCWRACCRCRRWSLRTGRERGKGGTGEGGPGGDERREPDGSRPQVQLLTPAACLPAMRPKNEPGPRLMPLAYSPPLVGKCSQLAPAA